MIPARFNQQQGLALVEFAIVAPVLLLLGFLAADFSRAYALKNTLTKAVSSAARYVAKQPCTDTGAIAYAENNISDAIAESGGFTAGTKPDINFFYMTAPNMALCNNFANVACSAASYICVRSVPFNYQLLSPDLYRWFGGSGLGAIPISVYSVQRLTP